MSGRGETTERTDKSNQQDCRFIYKIENGTLTMAGSEPGNPTPPASFQDSNARRMIFKKE